jgi:hypothetical protein
MMGSRLPETAKCLLMRRPMARNLRRPPIVLRKVRLKVKVLQKQAHPLQTKQKELQMNQRS